MRMKVIFIGGILILLVLSLTLGSNMQTTIHTEKGDNSVIYYGEWIIKGIIETSGIYGMLEEESILMVGKTLYYSSDVVIVDTEIFENPYYEQEIIEKINFYPLFRCETSELGLYDDNIILVSIVDIKGKYWNNMGNMLLIKDKDTLITHWDGVFFELKRKD